MGLTANITTNKITANISDKSVKVSANITSNNIATSFKGKQGNKGLQGDKGDQGPTGPEGPIGPSGGVDSVNTQTGVVVLDTDDISEGTTNLYYTDAAAVSLNTAKVTNATHTGDATGATILTLATVNSNVGSFTNADVTVDAKGRITAVSDGSGGAGDMTKTVYDPQVIEADAFARANHTGTITASVVSDFDAEVANNSAVTLNTAKNSYPSADATKLAGIEPLAEVNVITASMDLITGVTTGGEVTNGTLSNEFTIAAGTGIVIDWTDPAVPLRTEVSWNEFTDVAIPAPSSLFTPVLIDATGSLVLLSGGSPTPQQLRSLISLQTVLHLDAATVTSITGSSVPSYEVMHSILDYIRALGALNSGNNYSANGANLFPNKSVGLTTQPFVNRSVDPQNPSVINNPIESPLVNYVLNYQDGAGGFIVEPTNAAIDPDSWDDGSGIKATVGNNKWTIQRHYFFGTVGITSVTLGQALYSSSSIAKENIISEDPIVDPSLEGARLRAVLVVKKGATDLSDISQAEYVTISSISAGGGAPVAQDFQDTYDISLQPQILTDATKLAFQVQQGSGSDTDNIYEGKNGAGSVTFSVDGLGNVTGNNISSWNFYALNVEYTGVETTIASGTVLDCTIDGATIFRFINSTNNANGYPTEDSFYADFTDPTLSNLLATRG